MTNDKASNSAILTEFLVRHNYNYLLPHVNGRDLIRKLARNDGTYYKMREGRVVVFHSIFSAITLAIDVKFLHPFGFDNEKFNSLTQ